MAAGSGYDVETLGDPAHHDWLLRMGVVLMTVTMYEYVGR
jgi:hypothetical protein